MSADILNLRLARKRRDRAVKEEQAALNRTAFGRSKAEREHRRLLAEKDDRHLESHRLERPSGTGPADDDPA